MDFAAFEVLYFHTNIENATYVLSHSWCERGRDFAATFPSLVESNTCRSTTRHYRMHKETATGTSR